MEDDPDELDRFKHLATVLRDPHRSSVEPREKCRIGWNVDMSQDQVLSLRIVSLSVIYFHGIKCVETCHRSIVVRTRDPNYRSVSQTLKDKIAEGCILLRRYPNSEGILYQEISLFLRQGVHCIHRGYPFDFQQQW